MLRHLAVKCCPLALPLHFYAETRRSSDAVRVTLVPRYPLFGGWSSTFTFGYSLPLSSAVGKVRVTPAPFCSRAGGCVAALSMLRSCRAPRCALPLHTAFAPQRQPGTLLPSTVRLMPTQQCPPNARLILYLPSRLCLPCAGAQDGALGVCGSRGPRPGRPGGGFADPQGGGDVRGNVPYLGECANVPYFGECASHLGECAPYLGNALLMRMCTLVGSDASGGRRRPEAALHRPYLACLHAWWMRGLAAARLAFGPRCLAASTPPRPCTRFVLPEGASDTQGCLPLPSWRLDITLACFHLPCPAGGAPRRRQRPQGVPGPAFPAGAGHHLHLPGRAGAVSLLRVLPLDALPSCLQRSCCRAICRPAGRAEAGSAAAPAPPARRPVVVLRLSNLVQEMKLEGLQVGSSDLLESEPWIGRRLV